MLIKKDMCTALMLWTVCNNAFNLTDLVLHSFAFQLDERTPMSIRLKIVHIRRVTWQSVRIIMISLIAFIPLVYV